MKIAQQFARMNRWTIAETIAKQMDWHFVDTFDTIHNYIETETMTLRKGLFVLIKEKSLSSL